MDWNNQGITEDSNFGDEKYDEAKIEKLQKKQNNLSEMICHKDIKYPAPLKKGDRIALISPASAVKEEYVLGAMERIVEQGYEPVLMKYALGHESGTFSATKGDRLMDLFEALEDPNNKAILCNRGGYGCSQLLANLSYGVVSRNPKWLIGFSDVSALHALMYFSGIASIHGPMAKHIATMGSDDPCTTALFNMLGNGGRFDYITPSHEYNRLGKSTGILRGGNLAVLNDLANTPYDMLRRTGPEEDIIIFLEDISEPIYKVNRILWRLLLSGVLADVKGIIFGQFTEYKPDKNFSTMEDMIHDFIIHSIVPERIPVVYNFPVGHTDYNLPLTEGAKVELEVTDSEVRLRSIF